MYSGFTDCSAVVRSSGTDQLEMTVFGGATYGNQVLNDVWSLKGTLVDGNWIWKWSKWETTGDAPSPRMYHSAAVINNEMFMYTNENVILG